VNLAQIRSVVPDSRDISYKQKKITDSAKNRTLCSSLITTCGNDKQNQSVSKHMHCHNLQQKSVMKLVVDGFFQNVKTFVKPQMLNKYRQQQCMLVITQ